MEAVGQNVDQKAADELVDGEPHDLISVGSVGAVVLPFEGYAGLVEGEQPAVGDCDAVGVARQIHGELSGPTKRALSEPLFGCGGGWVGGRPLTRYLSLARVPAKVAKPPTAEIQTEGLPVAAAADDFHTQPGL